MMDMAALQKQEKALHSYHEVHENAHVQRWVEEMNDTLVAIEDALATKNFESREMKGHLAMMGLDVPKTTEDELVLYKAFRLMLAFMKKKLSILDAQSSNYVKTKRRLLELGRQDGIGTRRSAANR